MKKVTIIAALFVFCTVSSAFAAGAEWNFYGSARISTFYTDWENNTPYGNPIVGTGPDTSNYEQDLNGNARIGAKIKVSDTLTGKFEYGAKKGVANLRLLWGEWNFGAGSLGIGQNYTPLIFPISNQVYNIYAMKEGDTNMAMFGMLYGKRKSMVRLKFGDFQIAAVEPLKRAHVYYTYSGVPTSPVGAAKAQPNFEVSFPSVQAKYKFDFNWGYINLAGGWQTFDIKDSGKEYNVTSYVLGTSARINIGKAYLKGNLWGGRNVGNLADICVSGQLFSTISGAANMNRDGAGTGFARWSDGTLNSLGVPGQPAVGVTDNEALAGLIVAGYEIRKGLYIEGGYGYTRTELDESGSAKNDMATWYLQSTIFLAPGVFLTPEIGGCDGKQEGDVDIFYAGIKWQINF